MTITPMTIYWIQRLDEINCMCAITLLVLVFIAVFTGVAYYCDNIDRAGKIFKRSIIGVVLCVCALVFVPSTKQAAVMYVVPAIANNKNMQQVIKDVPELLELSTDWLKETIKTKRKNTKE